MLKPYLNKILTNNRFFATVSLLGLISLATRAVGAFAEIIFAHFFGGGALADGFLFAVSIPVLFMSAISLGLAAAVVPSAHQSIEKEGSRLELGSQLPFLGLLFLFAAAACLTAQGVAVGRMDLAPEALESFQAAFPWIVPGLMLLIVGAWLQAVSQSRQVVVMPASANLYSNMALGLGFLIAGLFGNYLLAAIAFLASAAVRAVILVVMTAKVVDLKRLSFRWQLRSALVLLLVCFVSMLGASDRFANVAIDRVLGANGEDGSIAALAYGFRMILIPFGLLCLGTSKALFPKMVARESETAGGSTEQALNTCGYLLPILAASSAFLFFARHALIDLFFHHGEFGSDAARLTSAALGGYALCLPFFGIREILNYCFIAQKKWAAVLAPGLLALAVNCGIGFTIGADRLEYILGGTLAATFCALALSLYLSGVGALAKMPAKWKRSCLLAVVLSYSLPWLATVEFLAVTPLLPIAAAGMLAFAPLVLLRPDRSLRRAQA